MAKGIDKKLDDCWREIVKKRAGMKCEKCGNVESKKHTLSLTQGVTEVASVQCATCGHVQMVKIRNPRRN